MLCIGPLGTFSSCSSSRQHCYIGCTVRAVYGAMPAPRISNDRAPSSGGRIDEAGSETSSKEVAINRKAGVFMILLALQFGCQPLLQKACTHKSLNRISLILATEATKIFLCVIAILSSGPKVYRCERSLRNTGLGGLSSLIGRLYVVPNATDSAPLVQRESDKKKF